jgi:hypothetical protein
MSKGTIWIKRCFQTSNLQLRCVQSMMTAQICARRELAINTDRSLRLEVVGALLPSFLAFFVPHPHSNPPSAQSEAWRLRIHPAFRGLTMGGADPALLTRRRRDVEGAGGNAGRTSSANLQSYRRVIRVEGMRIVGAIVAEIGGMTGTGNDAGPAVQHTDPLEGGTTIATRSIEAGEIAP